MTPESHQQQIGDLYRLDALSPSRLQLPVWLRLISACGAVSLLLLIVLSALLTPSLDGIGTHRGLGLPPCHWIQLLGIRCPACGMTTSWAWMARGKISNAVYANPAGALLFIHAVITAIVLTAWAIRGKTRNADAFGWFSSYYLVVTFIVAFIYWGIRLKLG